VAAVGGLFWLSACAATDEKTPSAPGNNVVIEADAIVLAGTQLSKADHEAMNQILNKYDKSLYRIDTYENGKRTKTQGKLTDMVTDRKLASQIAANVKRAGFTQYTLQIRSAPTNVQSPGFTTNVQTSPTPGANVHVQISPTPGANVHVQKPKPSESTERLKSILKKYQKK
jgi:hypothetical protein